MEHKNKYSLQDMTFVEHVKELKPSQEHLHHSVEVAMEQDTKPLDKDLSLFNKHVEIVMV